MKRIIFICCALLLTCVSLNAQSTLPRQSLRGVVTIVEPNGQFYTNIGSKDQLFSQARVRVTRRGIVIGEASVIRVNRLDSIANLDMLYRGVLLQAGDIVQVVSNPIPEMAPAGLPEIEPVIDFRDQEALLTLLVLIGIGSAINNP